ncbi:MAG: hypothetical protein LQ342_006816 [Letrouitia transgressa]|nr:MAG: hypothetical protein LQ342_006816 [Letrouitia transgressa]
MSNKKIEQWEVERYWEIFSSLANGGTHLDGAQAASVLKNSQLRDDQLERVWDLADVDSDGKLDFEEFCVAMRIIFDLVNGEYTDVPTSLPSFLIPSSKAHLITAASALRDGPQPFSPIPASPSSPEGLRDDFDWYMPPSSVQKYEAIYLAHKSRHAGTLTFSSLEPLYASLDVPDTDVRSAWNLVNPNADEAIGKHAALAFLHILSNRHEGYRIPRSVPPSLRASFESAKIDYQVDRVRSPAATSPAAAQRWGSKGEEETSTGKKAKFGDTYLSRLGVGGGGGGGKSGYQPARGTDFSGSVATTTDWEESRLKRELADLEAKIAKAEAVNARKGGGRGAGRREESKPALVKRELEMLLDYKRKELRELETGEGKVGQGVGAKRVEGELGDLREMVEGLERHWRGRESVLEGLKRELEDAKAGR